jgi:hypothetical protein
MISVLKEATCQQFRMYMFHSAVFRSDIMRRA